MESLAVEFSILWDNSFPPVHFPTLLSQGCQPSYKACRENTTFLDSEFLPQPGFWRPESGPSWGKNKTQALLFFSQTISFPRSAVSFIASQSNGSDIMAPAAQTIARVGASVEIQKGFYLCRSPRCFLLVTFDLLHNCSVVQKRQHLKHKSTYKLTGRTNLL